MENKIEIQKVWSYEQQILDVFADFCRDYNLKYSLAYGTLLGAVRHKGFIPWDDDIDVMMPREDYNKFIQLWKNYGNHLYTLVNHDVYPEFGQDFTKLMMNKTTFISSKKKVNYPQGIFIDIFPLDRVAQNRISRSLQYCAFLISMLYRRGYHSGEGGAIKIVESILFVAPKPIRDRLIKCTSRYAQKWNGKTELQYVAAITFSLTRVYYPANLFENMTQIEFSGKKYGCISDYDTFLKNRYGDYMKLPPKEEQVWKHRPILVDYEHDADELEEI